MLVWLFGDHTVVHACELQCVLLHVEIALCSLVVCGAARPIQFACGTGV
jgi:hypothetical protein